jgi:hypothetical protein
MKGLRTRSHSGRKSSSESVGTKFVEEAVVHGAAVLCDPSLHYSAPPPAQTHGFSGADV